MKSRLLLEPQKITGNTLEVAARLETPDGAHRLWWRLPALWADAVTTQADPFIVAFLFPVMQIGGTVHIEGPVSPSLLANLEDFMAIFHAWYPDKYQPVQFCSDQEIEAPPPNPPGQTIMPFSCGADSSFTAWRHSRGLLGRRSRRIAAAVVMQGFEPRFNGPGGVAGYENMLASARVMLDSIDVACIPLATNFQQIHPNTFHNHATQLAAGLLLFSKRFDAALIPNSVPCNQLATLWGSHPLIDPFLGSRHFAVLDDGAESSRAQKMACIAQWPQAMSHLHVCFGQPNSQRVNCCRCEKCLRTILSLRLAGAPLPPAFVEDVTDEQISRVHFATPIVHNYWKEIFALAKQHGLADASWVQAVRFALHRHELRMRWAPFKRPFIPIRNGIRMLFRGSPRSRSELAREKKQLEMSGIQIKDKGF